MTENEKSVTEGELFDRIIENLNNLDFDEFILEANRILGTNYTVNDVAWDF